MKILIEIPNIPGAGDVKIEDVFAKIEIVCGNKYVQYAKAKILEVDGYPCASPTASSFWNYHKNIVWDIQRDIREVLPVKNNEPDQDFYKNKMWGNDPVQKCVGHCCLFKKEVNRSPVKCAHPHGMTDASVVIVDLKEDTKEDTKEFLLREIEVLCGVLNKIVRRLND